MRTFGAWVFQAACGIGDAEALFVEGTLQRVAKQICKGCPVRYECLAAALDNRISTGVWGGMTERERRTLLRAHPGVSSWRGVFEAETRHRPAADRSSIRAAVEATDRAGDRVPVRAAGRDLYRTPVVVQVGGPISADRATGVSIGAGGTAGDGRRRRRSGLADP